MSRTPLVLPGGAKLTLRTGGLKLFTRHGRISSFSFDRVRPVHGQGPLRGSRMNSGLAGTIDASRVLSAQATSGGTFLTFTVLTGIIVGGTSILGGEGAVQRTVIGCLFVALVANGFNLLGLDPFYQQVTLGVILLLAVGLDAWSRRAD